jgi:hypothetical protein
MRTLRSFFYLAEVRQVSCFVQLRKEGPMSQKAVERILGKLATDEEIRQRFRVAPGEVLAAIAGEIDSLTPVEQEALSALDADLLDRFADAIDPRIQRVRIPSGAVDGSRT